MSRLILTACLFALASCAAPCAKLGGGTGVYMNGQCQSVD